MVSSYQISVSGTWNKVATKTSATVYLMHTDGRPTEEIRRGVAYVKNTGEPTHVRIQGFRPVQSDWDRLGNGNAPSLWVCDAQRLVTLVSALQGDKVPGIELSDPDCPEIPGLMESKRVKEFFEENSYGTDPDELMYLVLDKGDHDAIPDGFPTLDIWV